MNNINNNIEESEETKEVPKLQFKRLAQPLKQITEVAIPLHAQILREQNEKIEALKLENRQTELRSEQVRATKTVQLLKADLYELERINHQVREEDSELFHNLIKSSTKEAIEILSLFMDLHGDIFSPLPEFKESCEIPTLRCRVISEQNCDVQTQQVLDSELEQVQIAKSQFESVSFLQREFLEINALIKQFSKFVFRQKESIDTIEGNIENTQDNVLEGTKFLRKASDYKAASYPIAGAVIGGLILGPVGALVGLKIAGSIACVAGGSLLGFGVGKKLKQKQQAYNEFEMQALTYPSKSQSNSTPNISVQEKEEKKDL